MTGIREKYPRTDREKLDREAQADPDVRGARKGRRGQHDDARIPNGNDPGRVERAWQREGRG